MCPVRRHRADGAHFRRQPAAPGRVRSDPASRTGRRGTVLKDSGAEMLVNLIPTESHDAARFYADAAIKEAKIGFINVMPTLIVCDPAYQKAGRREWRALDWR